MPLHTAKTIEVRARDRDAWLAIPDAGQVQWQYATEMQQFESDTEPAHGQMSISGAFVTRNPDIADRLFFIGFGSPVTGQLRFTYKNGDEWRRRTFLKVAFCSKPGTPTAISLPPSDDIADYSIAWQCAIPATPDRELPLSWFSLLELMEEQADGSLVVIRELSPRET